MMKTAVIGALASAVLLVNLTKFVAAGDYVQTIEVTTNDFDFRGGSADFHGLMRSGDLWQRTYATLKPVLFRGSELKAFDLDYQYISGYLPAHGLGTGANLTIRVGNQAVYSSPHFKDYSYDKNRSNYSKPVPVRSNGLTMKVAGEDAIQFIFDNNDRDVLLQMPIRINLTCAPGPCVQLTVPEGPCDILAKAGSPCVAAHSVVRALYSNYTGALYRVTRASDMAALDIGFKRNGFARTEDQDVFCAATSCFIARIFDQSSRGNHLDTAPAGAACRPAGGGGLRPVNATRDPILIGGHKVYGAYFEGHQGYRNDVTSGVATGDGEEMMYMVTRGDHVNDGCCFDYGNAETDNDDDGQGTMEAVYFGTSKIWGHGQGDGPWVMADLENGLWAGDQRVTPAPSFNHTYVTAMAKGRKGGFGLKGGNAQAGMLQKLHEGARPAGYDPMKKQGAIILGIGGDASCGAVGTFYEGVMTAVYTTDAADDAIQANIVAAGYGDASAIVAH